MMKAIKIGVLAAFLPYSAVFADPVSQISDAAQAAFARMPNVRIVPTIAGNCGANAVVSERAVYCTTSNEILLQASQAARPEAAYAVAHVFGHAVQVQHGVADVALRTIRARRADEVVLRGYVERQVDCIAGFLFHQAGLTPASLADWMNSDPFDDVHWGRNPLRSGPVMPVPLADRDDWFAVGQRGDLSACAVGEFGSTLLTDAYRG